MHQFNEHHAALEGFSPFYFQVIGPRLRQEEEARKTAVRGTFWQLRLTPMVMLITYLLCRYGTELEPVGVWAMTILMAPFYIAYVIVHSLRSIRNVTRFSIIGGFCRFRGWFYFMDRRLEKSSRHSYGLTKFVKLGFAPKYNSATVEDHITGKLHGLDFRLFHATFSRAAETVHEFCPWKYWFKGQFISISVPHKFQGQTVVVPDKGIFNVTAKRGMKRVRLVDPRFEKMFEVYGTDQVEARYLLPPDFMQRLVDLEHAFCGRSIRFGFIDNQLLIAIETRVRLGVGSMFTPLDNPKRTQDVLDALGAFFQVMDIVAKPQNPISVMPKSTAA